MSQDIRRERDMAKLGMTEQEFLGNTPPQVREGAPVRTWTRYAKTNGGTVVVKVVAADEGTATVHIPGLQPLTPNEAHTFAEDYARMIRDAAHMAATMAAVQR